MYNPVPPVIGGGTLIGGVLPQTGVSLGTMLAAVAAFVLMVTGLVLIRAARGVPPRFSTHD